MYRPTRGAPVAFALTALQERRALSAHRAPIPEEEPIPGDEPEPEDDPIPHPDPVILKPNHRSTGPMGVVLGSVREGNFLCGEIENGCNRL